MFKIQCIVAVIASSIRASNFLQHCCCIWTLFHSWYMKFLLVVGIDYIHTDLPAIHKLTNFFFWRCWWVVHLVLHFVPQCNVYQLFCDQRSMFTLLFVVNFCPSFLPRYCLCNFHTIILKITFCPWLLTRWHKVSLGVVLACVKNGWLLLINT